MPYSASTVAETVRAINHRYFLPAIQRPFVWESERIVRLFDSLMKGFPISSFLFWDVAPENKSNWQTYRFAENFRRGEVHNERANLDGLDVTLVLDGQQRLTSLLIGLRGSYIEKERYRRNASADAWRTKRLYLDLLIEPDNVFDEDDDEHDEQLFGFSFEEDLPASLPGQLWLKVGEVLNYSSPEKFATFKAQQLGRLRQDSTQAEREIADRNLDRLYRMVWEDQSISFYTEQKQDYDRVLRIFVRANDAGVKLSKSDLMMSMIASRWTEMAAREEIDNLVKEINAANGRRNAITRDYVIKATLLLSGLDHHYQVRNLTLGNLDTMRMAWLGVKKTLRRTFALLNAFGIDGDNLTSLNATLPVAQYLHQTDTDLLAQDTPFSVLNAERIRRWLVAALLNQVFGGSSDSTIAVARKVIDAVPSNGDFPFVELNVALSRHLKRSSAFDDQAIENVLKLNYGQKLTFLALTLLYDEQRWGQMPHHVDHIFPRAKLSRNALNAMNLPGSHIDTITAVTDKLGNLQLLSATENLEKNADPFEHWVQTRDDGFVVRHHLPDNEHLRTIAMFPSFVKAREGLLRARLARLKFDPAAPKLEAAE